MTDSDGDRRADSDGPDAVAGQAAARPRVVAAAFAVVVFVGSVVPVPPASSGGSTGGVLGGVAGALPPSIGLTTPFHFLGYAALAALFVRAAESASRRGRARRVAVLALAAVAATAFGFGIELVQAPIPWRSFAWSDAGVNAAGAVVGAGGYAMTTRLYALARSLR